MNNKRWDLVALFLWYLPVALVQIISGQVMAGTFRPWYENLTKAPWTPPAWVFGPVWTILYLLMAVSVWMVYRCDVPKEKKWGAYVMFFTQLATNGIWTYLFFGRRLIGWALADLGLLIVLVALLCVSFYRVKKLAGLLQLPYLIWVIYAFTLNAAIWWLN